MRRNSGESLPNESPVKWSSCGYRKSYQHPIHNKSQVIHIKTGVIHIFIYKLTHCYFDN